MGRVIRLRHARSPLHDVKATVAALNEELEFTLNYAHAMSRDQNFHAAVEVIEEQRRSLQDASRRMHVAVAEPQASRKRVRVRAALAGVAAALALASGAFAALHPAARTPSTNHNIQAIQHTTEALNEGIAISDPAALQAIVIDAQNTILDVARSTASDPAVKRPLLDTIAQLQKFIKNPNVPAKVREQAKKAAETAKQIVVSAPAAPQPAPSQAPSASAP